LRAAGTRKIYDRSADQGEPHDPPYHAAHDGDLELHQPVLVESSECSIWVNRVVLRCPHYVRLAGNFGNAGLLLAANYLAFIKVASTRIWLRVYASTP
jgi:hypothetical protein